MADLLRDPGTHGEVLHAGTVNKSDATRYFISIFLTAHGLPHRDSFVTPQVRADAHVDWHGVHDLQTSDAPVG